MVWHNAALWIYWGRILSDTSFTIEMSFISGSLSQSMQVAVSKNWKPLCPACLVNNSHLMCMQILTLKYIFLCASWKKRRWDCFLLFSNGSRQHKAPVAEAKGQIKKGCVPPVTTNSGSCKVCMVQPRPLVQAGEVKGQSCIKTDSDLDPTKPTQRSQGWVGGYSGHLEPQCNIPLNPSSASHSASPEMARAW